MKRSFIMIVAAAVAMLAVWSCRKGADSPETGDSSKISISVTAEMEDLGGCDAKASIGTVYRLSWTAGDKVFVYDGEKRLGDLTVSLKDGDKRYAYLGGTITAPTDGSTKLTCVYAKGIETAPEVDENGEVKFSMASQTPGRGDTPFVVYGTIDYSTGQTSITDKLVNFEFATAVVLVNCLELAADGGNVTKAELSGINTNCVLSLSGTAAPGVSGEEVGTITTTSTPGKEFQSGNGKLTYQIGIPVSDAVILTENPAAQRKLIITQASKQMSTNFTSSAFAAGKFKNVIYTLEEYTPPTPPADGSLPGVFSVSATKKVKFSQGNLQYQASTNTWRFAEHQYDHVGDGGTKAGNVEGSDNTQISATYPGWIDLFGWATSGFKTDINDKLSRLDTESYQPWSGSKSSDFTATINGVSNPVTLSTIKRTDWGSNDIYIFNDGVKGEKSSLSWRTLTSTEAKYLLTPENNGTDKTETSRGGYRFLQITVTIGTQAISGLLVFPDNWEPKMWPSDNKPQTSAYNNQDGLYANTTCTTDEFVELQKLGVVFLSQTGLRRWANLRESYYIGAVGSSVIFGYWLADRSTTSYPWGLRSNQNKDNVIKLEVEKIAPLYSYNGFAVRLVTDVPSDSN